MHTAVHRPRAQPPPSPSATHTHTGVGALRERCVFCVNQCVYIPHLMNALLDGASSHLVQQLHGKFQEQAIPGFKCGEQAGTHQPDALVGQPGGRGGGDDARVAARQ